MQNLESTIDNGCETLIGRLIVYMTAGVIRRGSVEENAVGR